MDYIQTAGIVLAIWVVLRNIGNERECRLREIQIRIREDAEKEARAMENAPGEKAVAKPAPPPPAVS